MKKFISITGISLLEVLLSLVIASLLVVVALRYYQNAKVSQQTNEAIQLIGYIQEGAETYHRITGTYIGLGAADGLAILQQHVPASYHEGTLIYSPWGDEAIKTINETATTYGFKFSDVPHEACIRIRAFLDTQPKFAPFTPCAAEGASADFEYTYTRTA